MNQANLQTSPRLRRALEVLQQSPEGVTTRQWIERANICACNSVAAELRANGIKVECVFEGRRNGSSVFRYMVAQ